MNIIRYQYHEIKQFHKHNLKNILPIIVLIFVSCMLFVTVVLSVNPGLATRLLIQTGNMTQPVDPTVGILPQIFRNSFTGLYLILGGIVPFVIFPLLMVMLNAIIIGILLGSTSVTNLSVGFILASILPHGVALIPAMLIASAYGVYFCKAVTMHVLHKKRIASIKALVFELLRIYVFVIIPLMVIASILQVFVTPLFVSLL